MTMTQAATAAEAIVAISKMIQDMDRMVKWVEALLTQLVEEPQCSMGNMDGHRVRADASRCVGPVPGLTYDVIHAWKVYSNNLHRWELVQQQFAQPEKVYPSPSTSSAPPQQ